MIFDNYLRVQFADLGDVMALALAKYALQSICMNWTALILLTSAYPGPGRGGQRAEQGIPSISAL